MPLTPEPTPRDVDIASVVRRTPFVDTHEHLVEEESRTQWKPGGPIRCNDWSVLFSHYIDSDLAVAGMPPEAMGVLADPDADSSAKWKALEPWWPLVKNTGYGQAVRYAVQAIYDVREINGTTIKQVAAKYRATVQPGYYRRLLCALAGIETCQVNSLERTFMPTNQPRLLMQDLSILSLHNPDGWRHIAEPTGIRVTGLADLHKAIDWWFETYGPYAVAVKSQAAYNRNLDFDDVPAEKADRPFADLVAGKPVDAAAKRTIEDHLFWYCVRRATEHDLPVKLHTGYYAGHNSMPMARVSANIGHITELLRRAPDTTFVLMHICYPHYQEMVAIAKQWRNAVIGMCWSWIIDPEAATRFLRSMIVAAPASKVLTFGGDFLPVEPVVGHAAVARRGIVTALSGLVSDGWLTTKDAVDLVEPIMRGNAHRIFRIEQKLRAAESAPWLRAPQ